MKRNMNIVLVVAALGLVGGIGQGLPLYAQTQTQSAACPTEGPTIADTLKYINDAIKFNPPLSNGDKLSSSVSVEGRALFVYENQSGSWGTGYRRSMAQIYALDCNAKLIGPSEVFLECLKSQSPCVQNSFDAGAGWEQAGFGKTEVISIRFTGDDDHGQRLTRAVTHLIALLQQQYKQSHSDPKDPFAKPQ
jgi:hypothetical protein